MFKKYYQPSILILVTLAVTAVGFSVLYQINLTVCNKLKDTLEVALAITREKLHQWQDRQIQGVHHHIQLHHTISQAIQQQLKVFHNHLLLFNPAYPQLQQQLNILTEECDFKGASILSSEFINPVCTPAQYTGLMNEYVNEKNVLLRIFQVKSLFTNSQKQKQKQNKEKQ